MFSSNLFIRIFFNSNTVWPLALFNTSIPHWKTEFHILYPLVRNFQVYNTYISTIIIWCRVEVKFIFSVSRVWCIETIASTVTLLANIKKGDVNYCRNNLFNIFNIVIQITLKYITMTILQKRIFICYWVWREKSLVIIWTKWKRIVWNIFRL